MQTDTLFIRLDATTKLLLRLRAARAGLPISAFARDLLIQTLGQPTPPELIFLTLNGTEKDHFDTINVSLAE